MPLSHVDVSQRFPTNKRCLEYIYEQKKDGIVCPRCKRMARVTPMSITKELPQHQPFYECNCGKWSYYPRKDTIFAGTSTDLTKWFTAIFMFAYGSATAKYIQRLTGAAYKASFNMQMRIFQIMYLDVKNKKNLWRWKEKMKRDYRGVMDKNEDYYLASYQWRAEHPSAKTDPFLDLLHLAITNKL